MFLSRALKILRKKNIYNRYFHKLQKFAVFYNNKNIKQTTSRIIRKIKKI